MKHINLGKQHTGSDEFCAVGTVRGYVVYDMNETEDGYGEGWHNALTPDKARELAQALLDAADEAEDTMPTAPDQDEIDSVLRGDY